AALFAVLFTAPFAESFEAPPEGWVGSSARAGRAALAVRALFAPEVPLPGTAADAPSCVTRSGGGGAGSGAGSAGAGPAEARSSSLRGASPGGTVADTVDVGVEVCCAGGAGGPRSRSGGGAGAAGGGAAGCGAGTASASPRSPACRVRGVAGSSG